MSVTRREFVSGTAAAMMGAAAEPPAKGRMVGIQIGAVSFVDEGVEPVLDILQSKGSA